MIPLIAVAAAVAFLSGGILAERAARRRAVKAGRGSDCGLCNFIVLATLAGVAAFLALIPLLIMEAG